MFGVRAGQLHHDVSTLDNDIPRAIAEVSTSKKLGNASNYVEPAIRMRGLIMNRMTATEEKPV
jgi:hypothetical protein